MANHHQVTIWNNMLYMFATVSNHVKRIQMLRNCVGLSKKIHPWYRFRFLSFNRIRIESAWLCLWTRFILDLPPGKKSHRWCKLGTWFFFKIQDMTCVFSAEKLFNTYMEVCLFEYVFFGDIAQLQPYEATHKNVLFDEKRRPLVAFRQNFFVQTTLKLNGFSTWRWYKMPYVFRGVKWFAYLQIGCFHVRANSFWEPEIFTTEMVVCPSDWPQTSTWTLKNTQSNTLPKFNIAPEKWPSQSESNLPTTIFQGLC